MMRRDTTWPDSVKSTLVSNFSMCISFRDNTEHDENGHKKRAKICEQVRTSYSARA